MPFPYNKSGAPETALPCPLYYSGAAGIDIRRLGFVIRLWQQEFALLELRNTRFHQAFRYPRLARRIDRDSQSQQRFPAG